MALVSSQVAAVASPQQVDLSTEEDEGGVGGPIESRSPFPLRSPSPQVFSRRSWTQWKQLRGTGSFSIRGS